MTSKTAHALVAGGTSLTVNVPEAAGGKTVIGQLTVDQVTGAGFVTAYACDVGVPRDSGGGISKSDLNFNGAVSSTWSNRLIVNADTNGNVCFYTSSNAEMIIDINATSDTGITPITNQRTDTRATPGPIAANTWLTVSVPEAAGGKTVIGQLTVDQVTGAGFVTAYSCDVGVPRDSGGGISKSDLNFNGAVSSTWSNRLIVNADANGNVCFYTSSNAEMIIDINATSDTGITPITNQRTDTRATPGAIAAGTSLTVNIPAAVGGKTVIGQLTVDQVTDAGFVTAYACSDGVFDSNGNITRSDLNFNGAVSSTWSNRLIVNADTNGNVCFYTSSNAEMIIDINATSDTGITPITNQRTDTRTPPPSAVPVPPPDNDFAFLYEDSSPLAPYALDGRRYLGWNPCSVITYAVNPLRAEPGDLVVLDQALARLEAASGFDFVYLGQTTGSLSVSEDPYAPDIVDANTPNGQAAAVFGFSDENATPILSGGVIGIGGAGGFGNVQLIDSKLYIAKGGYVIVDMTELVDDAELLSTLMHEISHMLGLAHVNAVGELMRPVLSNPPQTTFGNGDLNGLYNLGAPQCTTSGALTRAPAGPFTYSIDISSTSASQPR